MECVRDFASNTNCHGLASIERSKHWLRGIIWTLITLTGAGFLIYQLRETFMQYYSYPVSISINLTTATSVNFPAVTICNVNQIRKSKLPLAEDVLGPYLPLAYGRVNASTSNMHSAEGRAEIREQFNTVFVRLNDSLRQDMGHQLEHMLLDCSFHGKTCSMQNFTYVNNPTYGNCYTFNSGWSNSSILTTKKVGPEFGLNLELYLEQEEYVVELTENAGMQVSVHAQDVMPFPESEAHYVSPDSMTLMGLKQMDVVRQPFPYPSKCWDLSRQESIQRSVYSEMYDVRYSLQACQRSCYQAVIMETCACADPTIPNSGQAVRANLADPLAYVPPCQEHDEVCVDPVYERYTSGDLPCNCSRQCLEHTYVSSVTQAMWPNEEFLKVYYDELKESKPELVDKITSMSNPGTNFARIVIYFQDLNYEKIQEVPSYTITTLLSDLGGSFGFYLGFSIVALFEVLELFVDLLLVFSRKCTTSGKSSMKKSSLQ